MSETNLVRQIAIAFIAHLHQEADRHELAADTIRAQADQLVMDAGLDYITDIAPALERSATLLEDDTPQAS
jgi:hypothetical protein